MPQPIALIEGYLQGYVTMYDHAVTSLHTEQIEKALPTHRITIAWEERGT